MNHDERETVRVTIDNLANGGDGAARLPDGRVVFVPRSVPGEEIDIEIVTSKKTFARGEIVEIVTPSPDRVESDCPHFERCGGCQFWHMEYAAELRDKTDAAKEAIERVGHLELPEPVVHEADGISSYRNRATFHVRAGSGEATLGFFARGSHDVVDVAGCPVLRPTLNAAREMLSETVAAFEDADVFVETAGDREVCVTVRTDAPPGAYKRGADALSKLVAKEDSIRGAVIIAGDDHVTLGAPSVDASEALPGAPRSFVVPAGIFRQANSAMNRVLTDVVKKRLDEVGADTLLEVFAGMGNFTIPVADGFDMVWAVEGDRRAVESGRALAELERKHHVAFAQYDLSDGLEGVWPDEHVGAVLLDPPRGGATEVCEDLADRDADGIVYVSCDAACLGRDLRRLAESGWGVASVDMVDIFPRTAHVETIVRLSRD